MLCPTHHRYLSYDEAKAGACFWCMPWMAPVERRTRNTRDDQREQEQSDSDGDDAQDLLL